MWRRRSPIAGGMSPPRPANIRDFKAEVGVERQQLGALLIQVDAAIHKLDPPDHFRQRLAEFALQSDRRGIARAPPADRDVARHDFLAADARDVRMARGRVRRFRPALAAQRSGVSVDCDLRDLRHLRNLPHRRFRFPPRWAFARVKRFPARNLAPNRHAIKSSSAFFRAAGNKPPLPESPPLNGELSPERRDLNGARS